VSIASHANVAIPTRKHSLLYRLVPATLEAAQEATVEETQATHEATQATHEATQATYEATQATHEAPHEASQATHGSLARTFSWVKDSETSLTIQTSKLTDEPADKSHNDLLTRGSSLFRRVLHLDSASSSPASTPPSSPKLGHERKSSLERLREFRNNVFEGQAVPWTTVATVPDANEPTVATEPEVAVKYTKTSVLGKGSNGTVRLAKRSDPTAPGPHHVAVKQFRAKTRHETTKEYMKRVIAEFCIASAMRHFHIVETFDLVNDGGTWCCVMEYMAGGDLYSYIVDGHLTPEQVLCQFGQLATGVAYLHAHGVAHRDLKPENVLVDASGRVVKITDFGVATVVRSPGALVASCVTGAVGSEPYIAPEGWLKRPYDATNADVWSTGVLLYTMLYQCIPWNRAARTDSLYAKFLETGCRYHAIRNIPSRTVRRCLAAMLTPEPAARSSAVDVRDAWTAKFDMCGLGKMCKHHESVVA